MLLVRPLPTAGESLMGFLVRLCDSNALESPRRLRAAGWKVEASVGHEVSLGLLRGPIAGLAKLNRPDAGGIPLRFWNVRRPRWCPACLQEGGHWPALWMLAFVVACDRHSVSLMDSCEHCGQALQWVRGRLLHCQCGADLRLSATRPAAIEDLWIAQQLRVAWDEDGNGARAQGPASVTTCLLQKIWLLGSYACGEAKRPQKLADLHRLEQASRVGSAAARILSDWPQAFFSLLAQAEQRYGDAASPRLTERFGALYKEIFSRHKQAAFGALRSAFELYVKERWHGQLAARNTRLRRQVRDAHVWVPSTRAAAELGWSPRRVRAAIERGVVRGHMHPLSCGRVSAVVHRDDLVALRRDVQEWITQADVCAALHIGKKAARALVCSGRLRAMSGPSVDGQPVWYFRRSDVAALENERSAQPTR